MRFLMADLTDSISPPPPPPRGPAILPLVQVLPADFGPVADLSLMGQSPLFLRNCSMSVSRRSTGVGFRSSAEGGCRTAANLPASSRQTCWSRET